MDCDEDGNVDLDELVYWWAERPNKSVEEDLRELAMPKVATVSTSLYEGLIRCKTISACMCVCRLAASGVPRGAVCVLVHCFRCSKRRCMCVG